MRRNETTRFLIDDNMRMEYRCQDSERQLTCVTTDETHRERVILQFVYDPDRHWNIDYPNFKDEVLFGKSETPRRRKHRHDVYFEVWRALLSLSDTPAKEQRCNWRELEATLEDDQDLTEDAGPDSSLGPHGKKPRGRKPSF
jgi:hypothetical protein